MIWSCLHDFCCPLGQFEIRTWVFILLSFTRDTSVRFSKVCFTSLVFDRTRIGFSFSAFMAGWRLTSIWKADSSLRIWIQIIAISCILSSLCWTWWRELVSWQLAHACNVLLGEIWVGASSRMQGILNILSQISSLVLATLLTLVVRIPAHYTKCWFWSSHSRDIHSVL